MTQLHPSVCPLDCPDTCSLSVEVEDEQITKVRGSFANPLTRGSICAKVTHYPEFVHGPGRLRTPLMRAGKKGAGEFKEISWDKALDTIYDRFTNIIDQYGSEAITPLNYAGPHGMLAGGSMDLRFFNKLSASQLLRSSLCGGIRATAYASMFGDSPQSRPDDVVHAKLIIVWGNNVTVSNLHLRPLISEACNNGAKLVVIDPIAVPIARHSDMHLAIKPGTDVVLAWALAAELERIDGLDKAFIDKHVLGVDAFMENARAYSPERAAEECGIDTQDIKTLAQWYKDASPAMICPGNGAERNRNGGSSFRAFYALPALAGKFGVRGGGLVQGASRAFPHTSDRLEASHLLEKETRTLNIVTMGRDLLDENLDPPIKGVFIYNHNAINVHPDQNVMKRALEQEDLFTVVCDIVHTDTVDYADIVLPASSHFEYPDIYPAYGQHYLQRARAVIPSVGDSLPNMEIFRRLAARFDFDDPEFQANDEQLMDDAFDATDERMQGYLPSKVPLDNVIPMKFDGDDAIFMQNNFPKTPSGKIEILSDALDKEFGQPLPSYEALKSEYPLWLVTPSSNLRTTSTFGGLTHSNETWLEMHPKDADVRGLTEGQNVKLWNDLGEVHMPLRITDDVRPGVVCSYKGAWFKTSDNGQTVSALAPMHLADLCHGACYNDARIEVEAV